MTKAEKTEKIFDPNTSFIKLPIVIGTLVIIPLISVLLTVVIICNTELSFDFSSNGFNKSIEIFKFPIGLLAVTIPIVALLAASHRSEQTKEQIELTSAQNRFSNYYKHREEFTKHLEKIKNQTFDNPAVAHQKIYGGPNEWTGKVKEDVFSWTQDLIDKSIEIVDGISELKDPDSAKLKLIGWQHLVDNLTREYSIKKPSGVSLSLNGMSARILGEDFYSPIIEIKQILNKLDEVFEIEGYTQPESWIAFRAITKNDLPDSKWNTSNVPGSINLQGILEGYNPVLSPDYHP